MTLASHYVGIIFLGGRSIGYPARMKIQYSISTILVSMAFVAITVGGWAACWRLADMEVTQGLLVTLLLSPYWIPFAFCAYALGRRRASIWIAILFTVAEGVSLAIATRFWGPLY